VELPSPSARFLPRFSSAAYLPLAHVLELVAECALLSIGASLGYSSPRTLTDTGTAIPKPDPSNGVPAVRGDAAVLRPTIMAGVPTVFSRIRKGVEDKLRAAPLSLRAIFAAGLAAGKEARRRGQLPSPFWRWLVFDRLKHRALGDRLRAVLSGGGPMTGACSGRGRVGCGRDGDGCAAAALQGCYT
jgi:long-chain acyl-CoA synthetase